MISPAFTFNISHKILPGLVTIGKYDGTHACLTAAITADKVLIHSPHRRTGLPIGRITWSESHAEVATLSVSQPITSLVAGKLLATDEKDILVIGSPTHILAFHVENNTDVFYQEIPEGSNSLEVGLFGHFAAPVVLVGGSCAVRGFDSTGTEIFWILVAGTVKSMILADVNNDGENELIIGSDDSTIRAYKSDSSLLFELLETAPVTCLASMTNSSRIAYALSNGTIGIYEDSIRLWRVKSKNCANSIHGFDLMGSGYDQLITGWTNGKVDARDPSTGDVVFKVTFSRAVAGVIRADYRGVGKLDLVSCTEDGEISGYSTQPSMTSGYLNVEQEAVKELLSCKQALLLELQHYEANSKMNNEIMREKESHGIAVFNRREKIGMIPANTRLQIGIATNIESKKPNVEISICTNNDTLVRCVLIFAEGLFIGGGESLIVHPIVSALTHRISVPIIPPKDNPIDIHIKAFVGYKDSTQFHVFELTRQLPAFAMYALPETISTSPKSMSQISRISKKFLKNTESFVQFHITERMQRICMWINQNFLLCSDIEVRSDEPQELKLTLISLRDNRPLILEFKPDGEVIFSTENMSLAGHLVQSLASFLNLEHLKTTGLFKSEETNLRNLLDRLSGLQEASIGLQAERAEHLGAIRTLAVRAEDARINSNCEVLEFYSEIGDINSDLIRGYEIRLSNYKESQDALKDTNSIIQQASKLRVGKFATNMIKQCRNAIKTNNVDSIIKIMRTGEA